MFSSGSLETAILRVLQPNPGDIHESYDLEGELQIGVESILDATLNLMAGGVPAYFICREREWQSFRYSEALGFAYARRAEDLEPMQDMIRSQLRFLRHLLCGVNDAQRALRRNGPCCD